ncbi:MAG: GLPGLI family protein [Flavobacterium sp.]
MIKKYLLLFFTFIGFTSIIFSQSVENEKVIHVVYKMAKYDGENSEQRNKLNPEMKQIANDFDKAIAETEMDLFFNKTKSIFKKKEGLNQEGFANRFIDAYIGGQLYYRDIESKEKIKQIDFSGEKFNVINSFEEYKWNITNESKEINGFKCYMATTHLSVFSKQKNKTIETDITVWFTPSIPYSFGPRGFDGLPGLVVEGSANGKIYFYASTIDLDYKDKKIDFEKPKTGKYVTPEELENIQVKVLNQD